MAANRTARTVSTGGREALYIPPAHRKPAGVTACRPRSPPLPHCPSSSSSSRTTRTSTRAPRATPLIAYWRHIERGGKMFWAVAGRDVVGAARHHAGPGHPGRAHSRAVGDRRQPRGVAVPAGRPRPLQGLPRLPLPHQGRRHQDPERPHAPGDRHQHPRGRSLPRRREVRRPDVEARQRARASAASGTSTSTSWSRRSTPSCTRATPTSAGCWRRRRPSCRWSSRATRTRPSATSSPRT